MATEKPTVEALQAELQRYKERLAELQDEHDQAQKLITEFREHLEDVRAARASWVEALGLVDTGERYERDPARNVWKWYEDLRAEYVKLARQWNRWVAENYTKPRGRPLEASEAQVEEVRKHRKAGMSLRTIATTTGLSLSTVRSILARQDRAREERRREFDKVRAREWRVRKRLADAAPRQTTAERDQAADLIKRSKGL